MLPRLAGFDVRVQSPQESETAAAPLVQSPAAALWAEDRRIVQMAQFRDKAQPYLCAQT